MVVDITFSDRAYSWVREASGNMDSVAVQTLLINSKPQKINDDSRNL